MTDQQTATFRLQAAQAGRVSPVTLIVGCAGGATTVGIDWRDYLGAEQAGPYLVKQVTLRMGSAAAEKKTWLSSPDQTATWAGLPTRELVTNLIRNTTVAAQVTPYNSSPLTVTFATTGLERLVLANNTLCGWSEERDASTDRTITGWVDYNGETGTINGQGQYFRYDTSTSNAAKMRDICDISQTVSAPCRVTFASQGDNITEIVAAQNY